MNGFLVAFYILLQAVSANCYADTSAIHPDICTGANSEVVFNTPRLEAAQTLFDFGEWVNDIVYPALVELGIPTGNSFTDEPNWAYVWSKIVQRGYFELLHGIYDFDFYLAYRFTSYQA